MLNHATCNDANYAPVPVGTVNDVAEAVFRGLLQLDERLVGRRLVHLTASVVHLFDFAGHFRCTGIAFFHQQVHHPLRVVHASGGIDARPQCEADVADGLRRLVNVCGAHQREDARSLTFAQLPQSLGGHDAVFAFEIDQIRTDTDGHKVEFLVDATFGQVHAVRKGLKQLERHPATGQFLERIRAIAALGVQDREGFREGVFRQMVVAHDDVDAAFGCVVQGFEILGSAVERDHQGEAVFRSKSNALHADAVPFFVAMRDVGFHLSSNAFEVAGDHGNGGGPVDIVIAVNEDAFFVFDGLVEAHHGLLHVFHEQGVVHRREGRIEEAQDVFLLLKPTLNQQGSNQMGQPSVLHQMRDGVRVWLLFNDPRAIG